jgi:hypothetical protein
MVAVSLILIVLSILFAKIVIWFADKMIDEEKEYKKKGNKN